MGRVRASQARAASLSARLRCGCSACWHTCIVREVLPDSSVATEASKVDVVVLDGRADLAIARQMCRLLEASGNETPVLLVLSEGGFAAVTPDRGVQDIVLGSAGPAEFDARIRLASRAQKDDGVVSAGGLTIDETTYHASLDGRPLDLTTTEFELLKYLAQHPGRVFSRETLLADVWGYEYYGGTRTVDVHVRRLRAKLGVEHESLIGTVRNVGYRFGPTRPGGKPRLSAGGERVRVLSAGRVTIVGHDFVPRQGRHLESDTDLERRFGAGTDPRAARRTAMRAGSAPSARRGRW